jgi:hypothetical protein
MAQSSLFCRDTAICEESYEVHTGENSNQPTPIRDRQAVNAMMDHEPRRILDVLGGFNDNRIVAHHVSYGHRFESLADTISDLPKGFRAYFMKPKLVEIEVRSPLG